MTALTLTDLIDDALEVLRSGSRTTPPSVAERRCDFLRERLGVPGDLLTPDRLSLMSIGDRRTGYAGALFAARMMLEPSYPSTTRSMADGSTVGCRRGVPGLQGPDP